MAPKTASPAKSGSVLLITLLVVSLLLVLVLSLTVYVRISLREVTQHQHLALARANARLGLQLAIAQLQEHAGPDQRVTATASLLDPDIHTEAIETSGSGAYPGVASPHWTGVWKPAPNPGTLPWESGYDSHPVSGKSPANPKGTPAWLVSGNHGLSPGSPDYRTPLTPFPLPESSDTNRLHLPDTLNPWGYSTIQNGVPAYTARPMGFGPASPSRRQQYEQSKRLGFSVWNNTSSSARDTNYYADSLAHPASAFDYVYRPTRGALLPILSKFVTRWSIQVDDHIQTDDPPGRKRLRLVMQPSFTLWNPYNVPLEVPAVQFHYRPDSGAEFVIETELESWSPGTGYRRHQEVVHNGNVYQYRNPYSLSLLEPGTVHSNGPLQFFETPPRSVIRTLEDNTLQIQTDLKPAAEILLPADTPNWLLIFAENPGQPPPAFHRAHCRPTGPLPQRICPILQPLLP